MQKCKNIHQPRYNQRILISKENHAITILKQQMHIFHKHTSNFRTLKYFRFHYDNRIICDVTR